jgi:hypothetical protein
MDSILLTTILFLALVYTKSGEGEWRLTHLLRRHRWLLLMAAILLCLVQMWVK